MTLKHYPVVIVGAGPSGMTAASLLGRYSTNCLVLDRWASVFAQPRAVHLDDEIYRILGDLGIAEEFGSISRAGQGLRLIDSDMSTIAEFTRNPTEQPHGFPAANMFDQPALEAVLRARMDQGGNVTFRGHCEVSDVINERDTVRVIYTERDTGRVHSVTADYVLGCDGANSVVRSAIGSRMTHLGFEQRWLVVDIATTADLQLWDGVHQLCDPHRAGTYMRIGETRYRWEFRLQDHETVDDYRDLDTLRPLFDPWLGAVVNSDVELIRVAEYTFHAQVADRWRDRRVFLLGDAAHLTPPFIGQGLGAGLRDAKNLMWKLVAVREGLLPASALDSYQIERGPHATAMIKRAVMVGWAMTGGGHRTAAVRKRVLPPLIKLPGIAAKVTDSATPSLRPSQFVRRSVPTTHGLAGTLCPNALVDKSTRFDEIAPDQTVVVTMTPPSDGQRREMTRRGAHVLVVEKSSPLGTWLRRGRSCAAIVRPDRTVMASSRSLSSLHTRVPVLPAPVGAARPA